ncbi:MAG: hypothetical protein IT337_03020 [Thermomicrobiales bacterium]|nr:hypothetical protein [Thermomicrobiales bacterium]
MSDPHHIRPDRRGALPSARRLAMAVAAAAGVALLAGPAAAHGFGQRFDLPLPLSFWVTGAGLSIVLSFAVMAIFVREGAGERDYPRFNLLRLALFRAIAHPVVVTIIRIVAVVVFFTTMIGGFVGTQESLNNIIVPMIWVIWWVGVAFLCALVGNVWQLINPLRSVYRGVERGWQLLTGQPNLTFGVPYPRWLGAWPAVILFAGFAWLELVWGETDIPASLARVMLIYSLITWAGMLVFGRETWLRNGEAFTIAFGILARFAPIDAPDDDNGRIMPRQLDIRPYGAGLMAYEAVTVSIFIFVMLMLSTVTFDGFIETPLYRSIQTQVFGSGLSDTLFRISDATGFAERDIVLTVILILFPVVFALVFFIGSWIMVAVTRAFGGAGSKAREVSAGRAALAFVLTLVPIAVAYHVSHYFTYLVLQSAYVMRPLSDPFALGWNLFGTAAMSPRLGTMNPYVYWYTAVAIIIIGHVVAVFLAHIVALRVFGSRRAALVSQIPMVVLMILYTTLSLWILAQPIVG